MSTTTAMRGVLLGLLLGGGGLVWNGFSLRYYGRTGPGPGFFLVWVGVLLAIAAAWGLFDSLRSQEEGEAFFSSREGALRVGGVLVGLAITWFLLGLIGYRLAIFAFALTAPFAFGRQSLPVLVGVALFASFGVGYVFESWLGVFLPRATIPFLFSLGL